ncbi:MAG: HesA/MoeB/ThiF family protein [Acetobacteraceae bacterium]|nr:HesA/MoeB/ThiF family protein [Acetobacteraceae bacterium]
MGPQADLRSGEPGRGRGAPPGQARPGAGTGVRGLLTAEQAERYARQVALREVGAAGQERLLRSRVLVVGAGGLGSAVLSYLAAAGVGTLGIVDRDRVEPSNLHRQILYGPADVGLPKAEVARRRVLSQNPGVSVAAYPEALGASAARRIVAGYDLVVDATDNFPTRYLLNEVCVRLGRPLVHGAVLRYSGQVSVLCQGQGPCYCCLFPAPPPEGAAPDPGVEGILGATPGVVGTIQAVECLKVLLGLGTPLVGRLLLYDGLSGDFQVVPVRRDPRCPVCSGE